VTGPDWRVARTAVALAERAELGRLLCTGPDLLPLLHRLSTADLATLAPGEGRPTVLTTPKGRIVERLFVHHLGDPGVLLVGGPGAAGRVSEHLRRYTFAERTGLREIAAEWLHLVLVGPRAAEALGAAGLPVPPPCGARTATVTGGAVHVLGQDGTGPAGFSVAGAAAPGAAARAAIETALPALGGRTVEAGALEICRVLAGLPGPGHELTEQHNPLEAGLWDAVSFSKGCYVGQEVIARLRTYDKVSRRLMGVELPADTPLPALPPGPVLYRDERPIGQVTSVARISPSRTVALAYVKRRHATAGLEVGLGPEPGAPRARLGELPFPDAV